MSALARSLNLAVHNLDDASDETSNTEVRRLIALAVRAVERAEKAASSVDRAPTTDTVSR